MIFEFMGYIVVAFMFSIVAILVGVIITEW